MTGPPPLPTQSVPQPEDPTTGERKGTFSFWRLSVANLADAEETIRIGAYAFYILAALQLAMARGFPAQAIEGIGNGLLFAAFALWLHLRWSFAAAIGLSLLCAATFAANPKGPHWLTLIVLWVSIKCVVATHTRRKLLRS